MTKRPEMPESITDADFPPLPDFRSMTDEQRHAAFLAMGAKERLAPDGAPPAASRAPQTQAGPVSGDSAETHAQGRGRPRIIPTWVRLDRSLLQHQLLLRKDPAERLKWVEYFAASLAAGAHDLDPLAAELLAEARESMDKDLGKPSRKAPKNERKRGNRRGGNIPVKKTGESREKPARGDSNIPGGNPGFSPGTVNVPVGVNAPTQGGERDTGRVHSAHGIPDPFLEGALPPMHAHNGSAGPRPAATGGR